MAANSKAIIARMSAAARVPYATVERMTRPLKAAGRWPRRGDPELSKDSLIGLIFGFAANLPSESLQAANAVENLILKGYGQGDAGDAVRSGPSFALNDAIFPRARIAEDGTHLLYDYVASMIDGLVRTTSERREVLNQQLAAALWTLSIGLDPAFADITWYEPDEIALSSRSLHRLIWGINYMPPEAKDHPARLPFHEMGIERVTSIPFRVFVAASEVCGEAELPRAGETGFAPIPTIAA